MTNKQTFVAPFSIDQACIFYRDHLAAKPSKRGASDEVLAHEKKKLEQLEQFLALLEAFEAKPQAAQATPESKPGFGDQLRRVGKMVRYVGTQILVFIGIAENSLGSYLGASSLLPLIPGISSTAVLIGSITLTVVNSLLFISFEVAQMKQGLGVSGMTLKEMSSVIHCRLNQIQALKKVNALLMDFTFTQRLKPKQFEQFATLAALMNQDLEQRAQSIALNESIWKKMVFGLVTTFGLMMTIAGSYYMAKQFLTMICASLLGTPIGWTVIAVLLLANATFYLSMQGIGMMNLVNPDRPRFESLRQEFLSFKPRNSTDYDVAINAHRQIFNIEIAKRAPEPAQRQAPTLRVGWQRGYWPTPANAEQKKLAAEQASLLADQAFQMPQELMA